MIILCPFCGHKLKYPIVNGVTSCSNCSRIFESNLRNKLLSAAWIVRKNHVINADTLINQYNLDSYISNIVIDLVADGHYTHDEFLEAIEKNNLDIPVECVV